MANSMGLPRNFSMKTRLSKGDEGIKDRLYEPMACWLSGKGSTTMQNETTPIMPKFRESIPDDMTVRPQRSYWCVVDHESKRWQLDTLKNM